MNELVALNPASSHSRSELLGRDLVRALSNDDSSIRWTPTLIFSDHANTCINPSDLGSSEKAQADHPGPALVRQLHLVHEARWGPEPEFAPTTSCSIRS